MFTACGHHGALGARATVLSDGVPGTLRRTLVLLGLLAGALTTSWFLGTASAQAEELDLTGGVEEVQDQVDGVVEGETPEAPESPEVHETPEAPEAPEVPDEPVDELGDTVTDTARETTGTVDEVTGALDETAPETPGVDVVGHVHETVDGVTDEVDQQVEGTVPSTQPAPETGTGDPEPAPEREHTGTETETASEDTADPAAQQAPSPAQVLTERDDRSHQATADDGAEQSPVSPDAGTQNPSATATGTASASSGAPAGAVAGFLPATGAPAPAPGPEQAALDVLRAVPAADAGEPTVAPD